MKHGEGPAASILGVRALGGSVEIRRMVGEPVMIAPHEALAIAQRLIDAAASAEGQKLLLRDMLSRGVASDHVGRH